MIKDFSISLISPVTFPHPTILSFIFLLFSMCIVEAVVGSNHDERDHSTSHNIELTKNERKWLEQNPIIRARVGNNPPLHFFDGKPQGISVDYFNRIAEMVGFKVEYVHSIPWSEAIEDIKTGERFDVLLTAKNTKERQAYMRFSEDYLLMPWIIFSRTKSEFIGSINDLNGRTVAVEKSFVMQKWLEKDYPEINILERKHSAEALEAVASGEADAYIGNLATSTYLINKHNLTNLKVACPASFGHHNQALTVRYDWPEFISILNKAIKAIPDRELTELRNKWFNVRYEYGVSRIDILKWTGLVVGVVFILLLISFVWNKRLKNEIRERQKAEERFRQLYNNSPDMYASVSASNGNITECNDTLLINTGYSREELVGVSIFNLYHEDCINDAQNTFQQFVNTGSVTNERLILECKSGEKIHVALNVSAVKDTKGQVLNSISSWRDITNTIVIEKKLEESENKYKTLFKSSADAILLIDVESLQLIEVNEKAVGLYGYSYEEMMALKATELSADKEITAKTVQRDQPSSTFIRHHKKKDGTVFPVEVSPSFFMLNGRKIAFSGIRDISERIKTEESRLRLESQLQQAQKMESIGTLAGGIAHDFNNILSSILGYTELALQEAPKGSTQKGDLEEVYVAGSRAKELVQQILAFARQSEEKIGPVRLSDIVNEALKLLRPSTPANIDIKLAIECTALVMGNSSQLHQVVMNLCTNAIHSLEKFGGVLEIDLRTSSVLGDSTNSTLSTGDYVVLSISDNGPGINPTVIDNIFEPYYTTKDVGEGTGMGLAMVKGVVENCGGDIHVKSEQGVMTSFVTRLPITTGNSSESTHQVEHVALGTERILFIDDEPPIAKMGSRIFESLGYTVTTRTSSFEALELFKENPDSFDLVISDMTMPILTGDVLSIEIRKIRRNIPIVLCTGYSNKIDDNKAKQIGIDAFVYKPFTKIALAETIRTVLDGD